MLKLGIRTGADLRKLSQVELVKYLGKHGVFYFRISRGQDDRPVVPYRDRKSVSAERTFSIDLENIVDMDNVLESISVSLANRLNALSAAGKTVTLKVRYANFETITRSRTRVHFIDKFVEIRDIVKQLLRITEAGNRSVRLLGVSISCLNLNQENRREYQPELPFKE